MSDDIDVELFSRQIAEYGIDAQSRISKSSVCIWGNDGYYCEIAKNLILGGINHLHINDTGVVRIQDLASNFYLSMEDIGKPRYHICVTRLQELNPNVKVTGSCDKIIKRSFVTKFSLFILAGEYDYSIVSSVSAVCHISGVKFIWTATRGVFGFIFNDFGNSFTSLHPQEKRRRQIVISDITHDKEGLVTLDSDFSFPLDDNVKHIRFDQVEGMVEINGTTQEVEVIDNWHFKLGDTTKYSQFSKMRGQSFGTILIEPQEFHFVPFSKNFVPIFDGNLRLLDKETFYAFMNAANGKTLYNITNHALNSEFERQKSTVICQTAAVFGGITAQEAIKSVTQCYCPICNVLSLQFMNSVPADHEFIPQNDRYDDYRQVFGNKLVNKIRSLRYFMVGAGAIGCELLKNFALLGVGSIGVTDVDRIERSNLSRQFLFRNSDKGKYKSDIAANAVKKINPDINISSLHEYLGPETTSGRHPVFSPKYFKGIDGIANALDNVQTRLFTMKLSIEYKKPVLESGTNGLIASFQPIVPFKTEKYVGTDDYDKRKREDQVEFLCNTKMYPSNIVYCVQWALNTYLQEFLTNPLAAEKYIQSPNNCNNETLNLARLVFNNSPSNYTDCCKLARELFDTLYHDDIAKMLEEHPIDSVDERGQPFWQGSRRSPTVFSFDESDPLHQRFISAASKLFSRMYKLPIEDSVDPVALAKEHISKPKSDPLEDEEKLRSILDSLNKEVQLEAYNYNKDDMTQGESEFVISASLLRAKQFTIPPESDFEIRRLSGNIESALATTTAIVSALITFEMMKIHDESNENYTSGFFNLIRNSYTFYKTPEPDYIELGGQKYSLWDEMILKDMTIEEFCNMAAESNLHVTTILIGSYLLSCGKNFDTIKANKLSMYCSSRKFQIYPSFINSDGEEFEFPGKVIVQTQS